MSLSSPYAGSSQAARALPFLVRAVASAAEPALKEPIMENVSALTPIDCFRHCPHLFTKQSLTPFPFICDIQAMNCYQCEQTKGGTGCTTVGVCGKTPEVTMLQDLLTYSLKGLSCWAHFAAQKGIELPHELASFLHSASFSTLTNVNFDAARFREYVSRAHALRDEVQARLHAAGINEDPPTPAGLPWFDLLAHPAQWHLSSSYISTASEDALVNLGKLVSLEHRRHLMDPTLLGLHEMLVYGVRGLTAYTHHAEVLGQRVPVADAFVAEAYAFLCSEEARSVENTLAMIMKCGEVNLATMKGLSEGHTGKFGHPEPSPVKLTPTKGKAILVSGHDMQDLHDLLQQTEGMGINVYTHGEMLPAHGYPGLKKFAHLVGNQGGAWYRQQKEFAEFPGPILMTTNCIIEPRAAYSDRIFTTGEVGWPGVNHIGFGEGGIGAGGAKDFSALIAKAQEMPGFTYEPEEHKTVLTGFGHNAVLGVAGQVVDAVKTGKLSHIFLIGGCDGSEPTRKYFGKSADATPDDTMVLTLGCGKFRFYDHDFGMLGDTGLPRLLDMGQCNDAYSAIVVASALADAFETDVNGLPLSLSLSWLEQKAIVVLLSLLHLGVKNIRIGPRAPAFLSPEALNVLVEKFDLKITDVTNPEGDVQAMLAGH